MNRPTAESATPRKTTDDCDVTSTGTLAGKNCPQSNVHSQTSQSKRPFTISPSDAKRTATRAGDELSAQTIQTRI